MLLLRLWKRLIQGVAVIHIKTRPKRFYQKDDLQLIAPTTYLKNIAATSFIDEVIATQGTMPCLPTPVSKNK